MSSYFTYKRSFLISRIQKLNVKCGYVPDTFTYNTKSGRARPAQMTACKRQALVQTPGVPGVWARITAPAHPGDGR